MARPRKDGKPPARPLRIGRERISASGKKWRVRSYAPTDGAPHGRVVYHLPATGEQTSAVPKLGVTLDELFDQVERALTLKVAMGSTVDGDGQPEPGRRDIDALSKIYLDYLRLKGRDDDYIANRASILRKWILPMMGAVLVADWCSEHSQSVITKARASELGPDRVADIGSTLSGMRRTAWRRRSGVRWLSLDENPMEEVEYSRVATRQGASSNYVSPQRRPATSSVEKAIQAAAEVGRWVWLPFIISIAAFCALRLGEQLGMRAVDVDLRNRLLDVNGAWSVRPSGKRAGRGKVRVGQRKPHPKNKLWRTAPYLGSQHDMLRRLCALALGLPEGTETEAVADAIDAERESRAVLVSTGDWRQVRVAVADECWLFPGTDGQPPTTEQFNDAWHVVRDACNWPKYIPYKNLRHHAALWWKEQGLAWETIAAWDGHTVQTLLSYYVVAAEDATTKARTTLDLL